MADEVEIKFRIKDLSQVQERLKQAGFREETSRTHEMNTLYDRDSVLRNHGQLLRLRKYGEKWTLTHKSKGVNARHKTRQELETKVADGEHMDQIIRALGYQPSFRYEKFRSEWSDGQGHVVLDETPIGNLGEIEGKPEWIDEIAKKLEISDDQFITKSYAELFFDWKRETGSNANDMTFGAIGAESPAIGKVIG
ncbi:MAG TPA: class IV adenylate cyclase [Terriglobales bacterium]|nr:class IV adenylate cyclase [Terriglobales bacterium]